MKERILEVTSLTDRFGLVGTGEWNLAKLLTETRVGVSDIASDFHCTKKGFDFVASLLLRYCFSC